MDPSRQKELLEYQRTLHWLDANRLVLMQEAHQINNKCSLFCGQMRQDEPFQKVSQNTLQLLDDDHNLL
jgi:hypothetical protein